MLPFIIKQIKKEKKTPNPAYAVGPEQDDDMFKIRILLKVPLGQDDDGGADPDTQLYDGAFLVLRLAYSASAPPQLFCCTPLYHPNISPGDNGTPCLTVQNGDSISSIVESFIELLRRPHMLNATRTDVVNTATNDPEKYRAQVKEYLMKHATADAVKAAVPGAWLTAYAVHIAL